MGETGMRIGYWWKAEGKRPLRRPRPRWVDNIKIDLRGIGWSDMELTDLVQDRNQWRAHVSMVMNIRVPKNVGNFLSSCMTCGCSRRAQLREFS
jgi:hypothetical protein